MCVLSHPALSLCGRWMLMHFLLLVKHGHFSMGAMSMSAMRRTLTLADTPTRDRHSKAMSKKKKKTEKVMCPNRAVSKIERSSIGHFRVLCLLKEHINDILNKRMVHQLKSSL